MSVFSDIELDWGGKIFTIRSNRVMKAIAIIEDHVTISQLNAYAQRGSAPLGKLCMAYAAVLRYAGARVTDEDVYEQAFAGAAAQAAMTLAITNLTRMMLPASARAKIDAAVADADPDESEEPESGNSKPAARQASSKKPSRRRSARANG